jgi:hypothetical protein
MQVGASGELLSRSTRRVAFAFDPERQAILLVAGDKSGTAKKRFYKQLIAKADARFSDHLARLKKERRTK